MRHIGNSLLSCLFVTLMLGNAAYACRIPMSQRDAWSNPDVFIIKAKVGNPRIDENSAHYPVEVTGILKAGAGSIPNTITVLDAYYRSTARTLLRAGMNGIFFVKKDGNGEYLTYREIELIDSDGARNAFNGLELFLRLSKITDNAEQRRESIKAWRSDLSEPEKMAVLDVMWETRNSEYADLLMSVAKGKDSSKVRSWAITILTGMGKVKRDEELICLLDDPDYYVRRQALLFLGQHNVSKAVPRIEKLIAGEVKAEYEWQVKDLKEEGRRTLVAITANKSSR